MQCRDGWCDSFPGLGNCVARTQVNNNMRFLRRCPWKPRPLWFLWATLSHQNKLWEGQRTHRHHLFRISNLELYASRIRQPVTTIFRRLNHTKQRHIDGFRPGFRLPCMHTVIRDQNVHPLPIPPKTQKKGFEAGKQQKENNLPQNHTPNEASTKPDRSLNEARTNPIFWVLPASGFPHPIQHLVQILYKTLYDVYLLLYFCPKRG